jgi:hypothetical protein
MRQRVRRRTSILVAVASLAVAAGLVDAAPVEAQDPSATEADGPVGFTDGIPVGGEETMGVPVPADEPAEDDAADRSDAPAAGVETFAAAAAAAAAPRYFGDGPWEAIRVAAVEVTKPCSVSVDDVRAMMVSPVFKESSAATTPSTSPSPMTLSRWDEWNGVFDTTGNSSANYGLYENRDPYTPYTRAYWHPGIGIWQYDSAGVGAPYLASERIDVRIIAADVARGMVNRYCASASTTAFGRRRAAWQPWGTDCTTATAANNLCEIEFQEMRGTAPSFSNISVVSGVSPTGGMLTRTCRVDGVTYSCWYVDPGRAQGATGWTSNPTGAPGPTSAQAPLSYPFYVLERSGREERHWLTEDTGYAVDISATRQIGKNARPRSGAANVGSGLTWSRSSALCDVTANRGNCGGTTGPPPLTTLIGPPTVSQASVNVSGRSYEPISVDLDGNGRNDIFWYGPGSTKDSIWISTGNGTFRPGANTNVSGVYQPKVLDANGDGREDILWYASADPVKRIWLSRGDGTFTSQTYKPGSNIEPVIVDRDGNGRDEILWYGAGSAPDRWWTWSGSAFVRSDVVVNGTYTPFVGDFDGNGAEDIFWYAPGSGNDSRWMHTLTGRPVTGSVTVNGHYFPMVGDFDGNGADDVIWYAPGSTRESLWWGSGGAITTQSFVVNELYVPMVVDLGDDGRDDVAWYDQADGTDSLWTTWLADRSRASRSFEAPAGYLTAVGRFGNGGPGGVFWYGRGAQSAIWWT